MNAYNDPKPETYLSINRFTSTLNLNIGIMIKILLQYLSFIVTYGNIVLIPVMF